MIDKKNEIKAMSLAVTDGLTVTILPSSDHEFLMSSHDVAIGYGVSEYAIRQIKIRHDSELLPNKHFLTAVTIRHSDPHNKLYWTKRGVVRLGFFIKSQRAKLFRDLAEDLVISRIEQPAPPAPINPVEQLMELALEANEVSVRRQLYQSYLTLRNYTEGLKSEVEHLKVNHDKWSNFIAKKTKNYQLQKGGSQC